MNVTEFKKIVKYFSEENIMCDEPHVSMRCDENNITLERVKQMLIDPNAKLVRVVEDRQNVYKLYYFISKQRKLKIVIDLFEHNKINIRTVKILNELFQINIVKRQRLYIARKQSMN